MFGQIAAALFAVAPAAPVAHPAVVTNPDWDGKPTQEEVQAFYPPLMTALRIPGYAAVRCSVMANGHVRSCFPVFESPRGLGFAEAATAMATTFRFVPKKIQGVPVDGGTVTIPIRFDPEEQNLPATASRMPRYTADAEARRLAHRLAELLDGDDFLPGPSNPTERLAAAVPVKPSEDGRERMVKAYEAAYAAWAPQAIEQRAQLCAELFSKEQLRDIVAFLDSPVGHAFADNMRAMNPNMAATFKAEQDNIAAQALKIYCAPPGACPDPATRPREGD